MRHKSRTRKDLDCQCPPSILRKLKRVWEEESSQPNKDYALGSLLSGILWVFEDRKNDGAKSGSLRPAVHLNKEDVAVDDPAAPRVIRIAIKQSKTDPVQEGHKYLPGKDIIGPLPSIRHPQLPSGKGVTKRPFISAERWEVSYQAVSGHGNSWPTSKRGIEQDKYCGHSPRIGAATTAAANGLEDSVIKTSWHITQGHYICQ